MVKQTVKKTKDRLLTESILLEAAEKVFSRLGFKGATTRLIAKEANCNLALINRYFNGKYGLLIALIEYKSQSVHNPTYPPQKLLEEEINLFGDYFFTNMTQDLGLFKIVVGQFMTDIKFLKRFRNLIGTICENSQIEQRLQKFIENGQLKNESQIEEIINVVENMAFGTVMTEVVVRERNLVEVKTEFLKFIHDYSKDIANRN